MSPVILQIDFPAQGPWKDEMAVAYADLADLISTTPGLQWKIWTEEADQGIAGGVYLFTDRTHAEKYLAEHRTRLASFGISDIRALILDTNSELSARTRGPLN